MVGQTVVVTGKTGLGRQLVAQFGAVWLIVSMQRTVAHDTRSGYWARIEAGNHQEWCLLSQDQHLAVLEVK